MFRRSPLACCFAVSIAILNAAQAQDMLPDASPSPNANPTPAASANQPIEQSLEDGLVSRLTLEEKISLIHGNSKFTVAGVPRPDIRIPGRWLSDGPHGVREDIGPDTWKPAGRSDDFATYLPAGIGLAATWDPALARAEGGVIGQEARARGKDIMLGPGVNILRTPLCGRNFEYMGEDPFLTSRIAVGYILGEQAQGVASCVKHFAVNNQEYQRMSVNVEVDERPLRELYLPAFKAAVQEAGVLSVMGAYNKLRGQFCSQNDYLLNQVLKKEWGFKGLVVSDWSATHNTREAALNGLDLEMGTDQRYDRFYLAGPYREGLEKGDFPIEGPNGLNEKVRRNLRVLLAVQEAQFEHLNLGSINTKEHQATARRVAEESIVLLKNEHNALPLDADKLGSIAVIGENATRLQAHGGQSSEIKAFYEITPLQGILSRVGKRVNVTYSAGYSKDAAIDDSYIARAVAAARGADAAIIVGGLNHDSGFDCEGSDRRDLRLPYRQDELIARVLEANPRTVVVLLGTITEMDPWLAKAPAVLQAWYPGMEGGNALARVIFGDVNPSGKLPCTFPRRLEDSPAHALGAYPGKDGVVRYEEGLLVGYRWFDAKNIEPQFPFGHGLSYTRFEYADLQLTPGQPGDESAVMAAKFNVTNAGGREGREIAQLYVRAPKSTIFRPVQELKGFTSMNIQGGGAHKAVISLGRKDFSYYDPAKKGWVVEPGDYEIAIGSSSRDIRLKGTFHIEQSSFEPDVGQ